MEMVHQMLSAAMAEDDSGNEDDKQEAARRADEGIAMLKARLEKTRAEEAQNGQVAAEGGVDREADENKPRAEEDKSPGVPDQNKQHQDGQIEQLKDQLKKSEATVSRHFSVKANLLA